MDTANQPRRLALATAVCAVLAVAPPALAQDAERPDDQAQAAAEGWADDLLGSLRSSERRDEAGKRIALQPLEPKHFTSLDRRQRQQVYEWMRRAFDQGAHGFYELVDMASLVEIADVIEDSGASDWWEQYQRVLENAQARVNIVCTGAPVADWITLSCSAVDVTDGTSVGQAAAFFRLEWLNRPIALDFAIGRIAGDIAARIGSADRAGRIRVAVVHADSGEESSLSNFIAGSLADAIHERVRIPADWIAVGTGGGGDVRHRLDGEVRQLDDRLVLRVVHRSEDGASYSVRENITLSSVPEIPAGAGTTDPCGPASEVAATVLEDGTTLSDWVLLAERRVQGGEFEELLVEAKRHLRDYCNWQPAAEVLQKAVGGIARELDVAIEADTRSGLSRLSTVLQAAGPQPALLRLKARAHGALREYSLEEEAYGLWLANAPLDHPERLDVLSELQRVRSVVGAGAAFTERVARAFSADAREEVGWTDLHYAAAFDLPGAVAALIEQGMRTDVRLETESVPFGDRLAVVLGADFQDWMADGETPLMIAAAANGRRAIAELIARGADVGATSGTGATALHHAVWRKHRDAAELLLEHGADVDARDNGGNTPLHHAAWEDARGMAAFLIERGAGIDGKADDGDAPLHHAAWQDARQTAALLLDSGASIEARDRHGATPLHHAAWRNARETAQLLLDRGADVDATTGEGITPLHHAAWRDARETTELLLDRGADIDAKDAVGASALHRAAWRNAIATATLLLDRRADIHARNQFGATPLHYAGAWNHAPETMDLLLARGADADATDDTGATAADYAAWTAPAADGSLQARSVPARRPAPLSDLRP